MFSVLDDICYTIHAQSGSGTDLRYIYIFLSSPFPSFPTSIESCTHQSPSLSHIYLKNLYQYVSLFSNRFLEKLTGGYSTHPHFRAFNGAFQIKHYAGDVTYEVEGFSDKNKDTLFSDLVEAIQCSNNQFLVCLYPVIISILPIYPSLPSIARLPI